MKRPDIYTYAMMLALVAATRTTCQRRGVGCVLLDHEGSILSIGYNGMARGQPHCNEGHLCQGADLPPGQDHCEAIHAEVNALLRCSERRLIHEVIVTLSPCLSCVKLLLGTNCQEIIFLEQHPRSDQAQALWEKNGRVWRHMPDYPPLIGFVPPGFGGVKYERR